MAEQELSTDGTELGAWARHFPNSRVGMAAWLRSLVWMTILAVVTGALWLALVNPTMSRSESDDQFAHNSEAIFDAVIRSSLASLRLKPARIGG